MMKRWIIIEGLVFLIMVNLSFSTQVTEFLKYYDYEKENFEYNLVKIKEHNNFFEYLLTFETAKKSGYETNDIVYVYYYEPKEIKERLPAVIVLDVWKTNTLHHAKRMAQALSNHNFISCALVMPYHMKRKVEGVKNYIVSEDIDMMINSTIQAVVDIRRLIDWLEKNNKVDKNKIGIVGISLGAIICNLSMGIDERLKVGVSILGGGDIAKILWCSIITLPLKIKLKIMKGYSLSELREKLKVIEPLTFANRNQSRKLLMINAKLDLVIPRSCTKELYYGLGKPQIKWLNAGHYSIYLLKSKVTRLTINFLKKEFNN